MNPRKQKLHGNIMAKILILILCVCALMSGQNHKKVKIAVVVSQWSGMAKKILTALNQNGMEGVILSSKAYDVNDYDGLIIPGGGDIDPARYGEKNEGSRDISLYDDDLQMDAVARFSAVEKPIMGICRGSQILNVYFGGTLHQDIQGHMQVERLVATRMRSTFRIALKQFYNGIHFHHQSIDQLGEGLVITGTDVYDGTIEGFQHENLPIYGFCWHPEDTDTSRRNIFLMFSSICNNYKKINKSY